MHQLFKGSIAESGCEILYVVHVLQFSVGREHWQRETFSVRSLQFFTAHVLDGLWSIMWNLRCLSLQLHLTFVLAVNGLSALLSCHAVNVQNELFEHFSSKLRCW
jgi:hypothetical protein